VTPPPQEALLISPQALPVSLQDLLLPFLQPQLWGALLQHLQDSPVHARQINHRGHYNNTSLVHLCTSAVKIVEDYYIISLVYLCPLGSHNCGRHRYNSSRVSGSGGLPASSTLLQVAPQLHRCWGCLSRPQGGQRGCQYHAFFYKWHSSIEQ
jgi:hypothetical protein